MIRYAMLIALALSANDAFATPSVGDQATFALTITQKDGTVMTGTVVLELLQFDATKNQFLERQTAIVDDSSPLAQDNWAPAAQFLSDAQIAAKLTGCTQAKGVSGLVAVPAGSFASCAVPFDNGNGSKGTIWVARVPLGAARVDTTDVNGTTSSTKLVSFKTGN